MKNNFKHTTIWVVAMLITLGACKGPQGDPGPMGALGAKGDKGEIGSQGPKGDVGTANVIQYTFTNASDRSNPYQSNYVLNNLPTGVSLSNSLVMVYAGRAGASNSFWIALPSLLDIPQTSSREFNGFYEFSFSTSTGSKTVGITNRRPDNAVGLHTSDLAARIVVVPASVVRNGRLAAIDYSDYKVVQKAFNLPD